MAQPESVNTMFQNAFIKNGDGDYSLKTSGGGGGTSNVTIDPSGNTVKLDQTGTNNTVKIASGQTVTVGPAANTSIAGFGKVTSPSAGNVIATLTLSPGGTYDIDMQSIAVGTVANLDADNFMAQFKGVDFAPIQNPIYDTRATSSQGILKFRVVAANNDVVRVISKITATSGAIYSVTIVATRNEV